MSFPPPAISILVCTRNRPEDVRRCVPTILANRFGDFELLVVDQSDGAETADFLESTGDARVRYLPSRTRGLARARNIALLNARAPLVAFTDDDCIIDECWIGALVEEFGQHPEIQGLYGRVLPWGDHFQEGLFCHCLIADENERVIAEPAPPHRYLGHGNNMAFRRELFLRVGLYNPGMGAGTRLKAGEDTDLTYRALRARLPLMYSGRPLVYHNNWKTHAAADRLDFGYVVGFVMVFGKFFLSGDRVAGRCLRDRLGELVTDLRECVQWRNWRKFRQTLQKFYYYAYGFLPALYFRIKGDPRWPVTSEIPRN